jgi:Tfp pilus assembly protein PilF
VNFAITDAKVEVEIPHIMKAQKSPLALPLSRETPRQDRLFIFVVITLTLITYLGTLRFDFVYDDNGQIRDNPFIKSWQYVPQYFVSSAWKHLLPLTVGTYYRPLFLTWVRLNYALFNIHPFGWHATSVLLHLLVTWLVYLIVCKMTRRPNLAWLTALIFGLHPVHHEVVAWISGSTESLFAALFLAAFLAYLHSREGHGTLWTAISCGLYALALLSKETAIVLPFLIFIHCWIADGPGVVREAPEYARRFARAFASMAFYIPIALIYLGVRFKVLGAFSSHVTKVLAPAWLWTMPLLLFSYLKHWLFPIHLAEFYDIFVQARPDLWHTILPGLVLLAITAAIWAARGHLGARDSGYAVAWILIPLLPGLDIAMFRADELVHDRYFYVPSLGASLLIALVIEAIGKGGAKAFGQPVRLVTAALALALLLALGTVRATSFWANDSTLFTRGNQIAPQNVTARINLSLEWLKVGQIEQAQTMLERTMREHPEDWLTTYNVSRVQYMKKEYQEAEISSRRAILLVPDLPDPYVTLAQIQLKSNRLADALNNMRRAVELNPYDPRLHTVDGIVLEASGDCTAAMIQFNAALKLNAGDPFTEREIARCRAAEDSRTKSDPQPAQR